MPRPVFNAIEDAMMGSDPFVQKTDILGKQGIHPLVKLVACLRYLACGDAYDREDENLRIAQSTLAVIVKQFCKLIIEYFGPQYLNRCPNIEERRRITEHMKGRGFPDLFACWDCKHFNWRNCPVRLQGQYQGHADGGKKTILLESICDHRKYLWQVNFGDAGSLNNINVLEKSSIVGAMIEGKLSLKTDRYEINGNVRDWMYFLVDGIYPDWAIFVNTFSCPTETKKKKFAARQEKVRKDIECAFDIVVSRFHVLERLLRQWYVEDMRDLVHCCTILHNMIVVYRHGDLGHPGTTEEDNDDQMGGFALFGREEVTEAEAFADGIDLFAARMAAFDMCMQSPTEHHILRNDLVEHINNCCLK